MKFTHCLIYLRNRSSLGGSRPRCVSVDARNFAAYSAATAKARDIIEECIAQIERPGWEERWDYANVLRIKGCLLAKKGNLEDEVLADFATLFPDFRIVPAKPPNSVTESKVRRLQLIAPHDACDVD
jgi:hypothetical protein